MDETPKVEPGLRVQYITKEKEVFNARVLSVDSGSGLRAVLTLKVFSDEAGPKFAKARYGEKPGWFFHEDRIPLAWRKK